jgi:hypothetical protein
MRGTTLRARVHAATDAAENAAARGVRRKTHDRLPREFPARWFAHAKLCADRHDARLNRVNASQSRATWRRNGWIRPQDPRGWFQWYCRYYMGRRSPDDARQIRRWRAIARHVAAIRRHCEPGDLDCRRRQRQAVLHWAYDSREI